MNGKRLISLVLAISLLTGCAVSSNGKTKTQEQNAVLASSFVVDENNTTYYSKPGETVGLGKMVRRDADGTEVTINEWGSPMLLYNEWLLFENNNDDLYKTKTDGSEKTLICKNARGGLLVDDSIYFHNIEGSGPHYQHSIARIDVNGENFQIISNHDCNNFVGFIDDWLYYVRDNFEYRENKETNTQYSLYRMRADGTDLSIVSDYNTSHVFIDGGAIYYLIDWLDEYPQDIYRTDLDGGNLTQLFILPQGDEDYQLNAENYYDVDLKDGWLYYYRGYDGSDLHRVRVDGTDDEVIFVGEVKSTELSGDWLFCFDEKTGYWYKMKPDGTNREQLYPDSMKVGPQL